MKNLERENDKAAPESTTQQEHRTRQDNLGWARKYLDLADQAMTGNTSESSDQR